ncbi:MAG: DNA damage-inducible protein D [Saprospiraceae bacterium]|nr:DNA damage-inducible protein D [Saprospiraceae bacterium]MCF8250572.1 DNA damage-inducible protein D [Saprospiraceae bacterium]MCF8282802.1 DNA damage-inducible protein D [Bacteroidales bacterium]MCF8313109.1 DNA damage-inducible protein D [Saprospiraceae bacterium]MCF8441527.1 DNA damage-inducible protein D [Saprospiraceae bacterium]
MKKELIAELFDRFEKACYLYEDVECWSARELMEILGYSKWENFKNALEKAKTACEKAGEKTTSHFVDVAKTVDLAKGAKRKVEDMALTRYACYLVAQNSDPTKQEVAFAQTYFAVQTRKQELIEKRLLDVERVTAREKLSQSEKKLSQVIYERAVDEKGFALIRSKGDMALFGGFSTSEMKLKLGVPDSKPLADFLPSLTIKAKDFATELTSHNVLEKDLKGQNQITKEHVENNTAVRKMLVQRGIKPEALPPAEDVSKVKRRLVSEEKSLPKAADKIEK